MSSATVTVPTPSSTLLDSTPCATCGTHVSHPGLHALQDAQTRIQELESQVKILTLRATSAVERATEYEVSLRRMASHSSKNSQTNIQVDLTPPQPGPGAASTSTSTPAPEPTANTQAIAPPAQTTSRLARLLSTRSTASTNAANPSRTASAPPEPAQQQQQAPPPAARPFAPPQPSPSEVQLQAELTKEQSRRREAEKAAAKTNSEIEELTGELFERANEMVAQERKARAKLEARIEVLEKRDTDKAKRLGLLESRVQRIERVRGLLSESKS